MSRILLKLSGEALSGNKGSGFDETTCASVAKQIAQVVSDNHEVGIVIGGGNFWRGRTSANMDRIIADQVGMMATVMNCLYMSDHLRRQNISTKIMTPFPVGTVCESFSRDAAISALTNKTVVFFAGGTGHPFFSTDTTTVLRALEIAADSILVAKAIDGIYDDDPKTNPNAQKFDEISIETVVDKQLLAMDLTASIMCMENKMPMLVFSLREEDSIIHAVPDSTGKVGRAFNGTKVTV